MKTAEEWAEKILNDSNVRELATCPELPNACERARWKLALATSIKSQLDALTQERDALKEKYQRAIKFLRTIEKGQLIADCELSVLLAEAKEESGA